ncbi:MAG: GNAT family N-acetyltransferase [Solobacterium sp.]|jgi:RimJ/RimL family protein N-acetyltransferase|nr:GNAT family N-acetyltransferase [Solobacterium sp.]MCH4221776.1 GNAT family N-acetyltransferase [Solobacterium sp.]MCH4266593.1 GNAT family N-acetyltransferase [Solobacterium sp.]
MLLKSKTEQLSLKTMDLGLALSSYENWMSDPDTVSTYSWNVFPHETDAAQYILERAPYLESDRFFDCAVMQASQSIGEFTGSYSPVRNVIDAGFSIGSKHFDASMLELLLKEAFSELFALTHAESIQVVAGKNSRTIQVLEGCGFTASEELFRFNEHTAVKEPTVRYVLHG